MIKNYYLYNTYQMQGPLANYRVKRKALGFFPGAFFLRHFKTPAPFFYHFCSIIQCLRVIFFNLFKYSILNKSHSPFKKCNIQDCIMLFLNGITYYQIIYYCYLFNFRPEANSLVIFIII